MTPPHDPENCPDCRPIVFDPKTGKVLRAGHPLQLAADQAWRDALPAQRVAWHRVTCLNSADPLDRILATKIVERIEELS